MDIITRAEWGAAPPRGTLLRVTWKVGGTLWLHHTVSAFIVPEGAEPSVSVGVLVWVGKSPPNMRTLGLRHPGKLFDAPVHGSDGKWRVYAHASAGKAKRAEWLANVTRTKAAERRAMREIQAFHQRSRGWTDIGYAFVCFPSGRVYEGRGEHVGAHCPGHNSEPSVSLAGDYSTRKPTDKQRLAVSQLKSRIAAARLKGHRDGFPTSCPGDAAYRAFGLNR